MKSLLIAAWLLGWGTAGPLWAADVAVAGNGCPDRGVREGARAYGLRARDFCVAGWTRALGSGRSGGQTHDEFIDTCLRQCVTARGATSGASLGWILGGVGAAALAGGVAAEAGGGSRAPPASP
jgi:hypothetical protein